MVAFLGAASIAEALPRNANGTVISGTATIVDTSGTRTDINQTSDIAEINWTDFDVGSGQEVYFNVPRNESLTVNRVLSGTESTIAGRLQSNGQIYLINEHGFRFLNGAKFNAESMLLSTIDTFNVEADANQYAEIIFDSTVSFLNSDEFVVISPFVGFYSTTGNMTTGASGVARIYSANRATVAFSGADNDFSIDVPDAQPDVVVPGGKKLGIEVERVSGGYVAFEFSQLKMVAKAVSIAQNIDALINLDSNGGNLSFRGNNYLSTYYDPTFEYNVDFYSAGHIWMQKRVSTGTLYSDNVTSGATNKFKEQDTRFVAAKNIFIEDLSTQVNDIYIEAGHNLILNDGYSLYGEMDERGVYGHRTIKLGSGTLSVENTEIDFSTLTDISDYAPGSFGHVNSYWVSKQDYSKPADNASWTYYGPDGNIALKTTLIAPNIDINADIDLTGAVSERDWKTNTLFETGGTTYRLFDDPGAGDAETAELTLQTTGDVNINANINMAGMGDINVTAINYNINGPAVVDAGSSSENFTVYTPPPPPAPPASAEPPIVEAPTFEELVENLTPETVSVVKESFYERFATGTENIVDQQIVQKPKTAETKTSKDLTEQETPDDTVAATCLNGRCVVLDEEEHLVTIEEEYIKRNKAVKTIVDHVVNLKKAELYIKRGQH